MNKNWIRGLRCRASEQLIAKPTSIKSTGGKSSGCAWKAIELTSGELLHVTESLTLRVVVWQGRAGDRSPLCRFGAKMFRRRAAKKKSAKTKKYY